MAFITRVASGDTPCYSCGKQCIGVEFCDGGATYGFDETNSVSYSRNIKVSITANPGFWGFTGVLISGWATYSNGYYDFFDGHDEDHKKEKTCGSTTSGPFLNEQRPDVLYRTVYDPYDSGLNNYAGRRHYGAGGTVDNINRGGAEVYLVDRVASSFSDESSCDETPPEHVFRKFPEKFGWGNKINFNTKIYKNLTGAWRLSSLENCHDVSHIYNPPGLLLDCSGEPKQNIAHKENQYSKYELTRRRIKTSGVSSYYDYESGCYPDGAVAGKYTGKFPVGTASIYRDTSSSDFIQAKLSYDGGPASCLKNGMTIGIKNDVDSRYNAIYVIFDINHSSIYSAAKFVGTTPANPQPSPLISTGNFSIEIGNSGHWVAFDTHDPQTCCSLDAYGVSDENKSICETSYHIDFRRVFNNPKNLRQSNRDTQWRFTYGLFDPIASVATSGSGHYDHLYPSVSGGFVILQTGTPPSFLAVASGTGLLPSGYPLFERYLPYYGRFYEIDKCDNAVRMSQSMNQMKNRNGTCYSKSATLEVFPDCITQYDSYNDCEGTLRYMTNRVPRFSFVYRGCDFNDNCSFDASGRPLGGWKDQGSVPVNMTDLKRQLGGQEIHMFINLADAWGGRLPEEPCSCGPESLGTLPPDHMIIPSPMTFPSLPNFDLNPVKYGCNDARYQLSAYKKNVAVPTDVSYCDPLHAVPEACSGRQPYTTYGYIRNLCGKQDKSRKSVITEAFAKLHQDMTYTNVSTGVSINEPMYWNVVAPDPAPYAVSGNKWFDGTSSYGGGFGNPTEVGGSGYGYWGLTDATHQLIVPYFCTQKASGACEDHTPIDYLSFSSSGTFFNVLGTANGWPKEGVPFFIEIEVDDTCLGCVVQNMENKPLHLEFSGLNSEFIHAQGDKYGFGYCDYGSSANRQVAKSRIDPSFSCPSGFELDICTSGDGLRTAMSYAKSGNTCSCIDGYSTTLYPVVVSGSDFTIGYKSSGEEQSKAGFRRISGCSNGLSAYLDTVYVPRYETSCGYSLMAKFELTCPGFHDFLIDLSYPISMYGGDPISNLWNASSLCGHHYPARVGSDGDLELKSTFYLISNESTGIFYKFTPQFLKTRETVDGLDNPITLGNFYGGYGVGMFGFCEGDKIWTYGCNVSGKWHGAYAYGAPYDPFETCVDVDILPECTGRSICESCPSGTGSGELLCSCGSPSSYEGIDRKEIPDSYSLCSCLCLEPQIIAEYVITSGNGLALVSGDATAASCAEVIWVAGSGANGTVVPPTYMWPKPQCQKIGKFLGTFTSNDWYEYSHGVNAIVSGITYEMTEPFIGGLCNQMSSQYDEDGTVCQSTGCFIDNNVYTKTCGIPINSSGNSSFKVRKKKCHPEVAIVTKIDCIPPESGSGYYLHLSREYHEHNRNWQTIIVVAGEETCVPITRGSYKYNDGTCSGCTLIEYAIPADSVTPAYDPPCSIHPSSGLYVNQNFQLGEGPCVSGEKLWNYFNLFYTNGFPSAGFTANLGINYLGESDCYASGSPIPIEMEAIFDTSEYSIPPGSYGRFATNRKHSCVQDSVQCGGELWCNKLLFPRHSYVIGTKIAPFAAPSVCTTTSEFKPAFDLHGYTSNGEGKYLLKEQAMRYTDWCKDENLAFATSGIGIDDIIIRVDDYLPLMGIVHPGWRFTSDVKSCTFGGTGCQDRLPVHSEHSILAGLHMPKTYLTHNFESMGYYLDRIGVSTPEFTRASSGDFCLFNPFKILIDVECSTNNIAKKSTPDGMPTYLRGTQEWPSSACLSHRANPGCTCESTACSLNSKERKGTCKKFVHVSYEGQTGVVAPICTGFTCGLSGPDYTECSGSGYAIETYTVKDKLANPDNFIDGNISGEYVSGICNYYCPGQTGASPTGMCYSNYVYITPGGMDVWKISVCDGKYYFLSEESWHNIWQCDEYQYLGQGYPTECECEQAYAPAAGLCSAEHRCIAYTGCACPFVEMYPTIPTSGSSANWWASDCHCLDEPLTDSPCEQTMVGFTITEES